MPLVAGLSEHDDNKHVGSAKRDAVSGVCGLDATGEALVSQAEPRTVDGIITAGIGADLTAHDASTAAHGVAEVADVATVSAEIDADVGALVATIGEANGIAALDASAEVISRLAYENVANGVAGLDANVKLANNQMPGLLQRYLISNDLLHSHDEMIYNNSTSYELQKTITIVTLDLNPSTIRVSFDMKSDDGVTTVYARIYKNGVPFGTERSRSSVSFTTYTEDLSFSEGDTLELWTKGGGGIIMVSVMNFRVLGTKAIPLDYAIINSVVGVANAWDAVNS